MTDILSLFVSNEKAFFFIKKTFRVTFILFLANAAYGMFQLWDWYSFIKNLPASTTASTHRYFYNYIIWPVIYIVDIILVIIGSALNYKGYKHLMSLVRESNDILLNKAFKNFYIAYSLFL